MALEILQRICPREASLLNDPCIHVKVRLRYVNFNKSSAVAEMGDRGHNRHGPKRGGLLYPFRGSLDPV